MSYLTGCTDQLDTPVNVAVHVEPTEMFTCLNTAPAGLSPHVYVNGDLFNFDIVLTSAGNGPVYKAKAKLSISDCFFDHLLLLAAVESNPGPTDIVVASLNCRSAVTKGAVLHDCITSNNIDVLALNETQLLQDDPNVTLYGASPPGYVVTPVWGNNRRTVHPREA